MTQKKSSPKGKNKQQVSIGSLAVMLLLILVYWWLTGSLPSNEELPAEIPVANATAVATTMEVGVLDGEADADTPKAEATEAEATEAEIPEAEASATVVAEEDPPTVEPTVAPTVEQVAAITATPTALPTATATQRPAPTATATPKPTATPTNPARAGPSGMPTINYDKLPREAIETIILIAEGGPFPFDRDGITFQNREGLLPNKPRGYYAEYTVITPGADTRGARRIIAGEEGEIYYTDDHYESFSWVVLP